jgi:hypothetical protein
MPNSRKRKKKSPKNKVDERPKRETTSRRISPDPIKMKYFEASFADSSNSTFEERLDKLKDIGRNASLEFPKKYQAIQDWFKKYDQLKLLSFSFYYFITSPEGYDEEAVTGKLEFPPYYQEILQAFALTLPRTYNAQPFSNEVKQFKSDIKNVGELNKQKYYDFPESIKTADDLPFHILRMDMMMHTTVVRNWSYDHKMKEVSLELADKITKDFHAVHDFNPVIFLNIVYKMTEEVERRINEHRFKTVDFLKQKDYNKVIDAYEAKFPVQKNTPQERLKLWQMFGKNLENLKAMLLLHSDFFLEPLFTFDFDTLSSYCNGKISTAKLKEIFGEISFQFGDLTNYEHEQFLLSNPVHEKPFIRVTDDTIFSTLWSIMTHLSIGILEVFCSKSEKLRKKYNELRGIYLEDKVADLFRTSFPMAKIYTGSKWSAKNGKEYENDLLVIIDKFALIVEAKAGLISAPAKRGAPERLFKTLQQLIEEPSEQALRFIDFLKENPKELSLKIKKGPNNKFDASNLKYFIPLGVTLSHLGSTSSNLKQLIRAGVTRKPIEELATSISLTDLQIVFDLLPLAAEKLHYLQRRRELEANIEFVGDEVDLLAWYLDDGFNLGTDFKKYGLFKMDLKSKELDNYIIGSSNREKVRKPALRKTNWWKDMLERIEKRQQQTWLETSYVLLNCSFEIQQEFERLINLTKRKMHNGKADYPHNWILLETAEKERKFTIAGYCYHNHLREDRDDIMGDILYDKSMDDAKGKLVIGMNIDKLHYPYSVLGCWLSSELFDNKYLKLFKASEAK